MTQVGLGFVWVTEGRTEHYAMLLEPLIPGVDSVLIKWTTSGIKKRVPVSSVRLEDQGSFTTGRRRRRQTIAPSFYSDPDGCKPKKKKRSDDRISKTKCSENLVKSETGPKTGPDFFRLAASQPLDSKQTGSTFLTDNMSVEDEDDEEEFFSLLETSPTFKPQVSPQRPIQDKKNCVKVDDNDVVVKNISVLASHPSPCTSSPFKDGPANTPLNNPKSFSGTEKDDAQSLRKQDDRPTLSTNSQPGDISTTPKSVNSETGPDFFLPTAPPPDSKQTGNVSPTERMSVEDEDEEEFFYLLTSSPTYKQQTSPQCATKDKTCVKVKENVAIKNISVLALPPPPPPHCTSSPLKDCPATNPLNNPKSFSGTEKDDAQSLRKQDDRPTLSTNSQPGDISTTPKSVNSETGPDFFLPTAPPPDSKQTGNVSPTERMSVEDEDEEEFFYLLTSSPTYKQQTSPQCATKDKTCVKVKENVAIKNISVLALPPPPPPHCTSSPLKDCPATNPLNNQKNFSGTEKDDAQSLRKQDDRPTLSTNSQPGDISTTPKSVNSETGPDFFLPTAPPPDSKQTGIISPTERMSVEDEDEDEEEFFSLLTSSPTYKQQTSPQCAIQDNTSVSPLPPPPLCTSSPHWGSPTATPQNNPKSFSGTEKNDAQSPLKQDGCPMSSMSSINSKSVDTSATSRFVKSEIVPDCFLSAEPLDSKQAVSNRQSEGTTVEDEDEEEFFSLLETSPNLQKQASSKRPIQDETCVKVDGNIVIKNIPVLALLPPPPPSFTLPLKDGLMATRQENPKSFSGTEKDDAKSLQTQEDCHISSSHSESVEASVTPTSLVKSHESIMVSATSLLVTSTVLIPDVLHPIAEANHKTDALQTTMAVLPNIVGHHIKDTVTQFVPEEDSSGKHETSKEDGGDDLLPKKHPVLSMTTSSNPKYLHETVHAKAHQFTIKIKNPPFPTSEPEKALDKPKGNKLPIKKPPPPPPPPPVQPKEDDGNDLSQKQYPAFPMTTSSTTKHVQERGQTKAHQLAIKNPPFPTSAPEKALDKPKGNKLLDEKAPPPPGRPQSNEDLGLSQNFKQLALLSANSSPKSTKPKKTGNSFKFKTSIIFKKTEILKEAKIDSPAKKPKLDVVSSKNQDRQRIEEAIGLPNIQKANTELQCEFMVRGDCDVVPLEETTKSTNVRLLDHRNGDLRNMLPSNIQEKSRKKLGDGIPMIAKKGTVLGQDKLCKKTMDFGVQTVQPCKIVEKRHNLIFPGLTMGDEPRMKQSNKKRTDSKAEKKDGKDDYQDMAPKLLHCMKSEHLSLQDSRHRIVPTLRKAPPQHLLFSEEESPGQHIRPVSPTEILKQDNLGSNRASGVEFGCRSVGKTSTITASSKQCASMFKDTEKNERIIQKQLGQCKTMQCRVEMLASPKRKGPSKHVHKPITKKKRSNESVGIKPFPTKAKQLKKQGYLSSFIKTIKGGSGFEMTLATQTTKKRDENKNLHRMTVPEQQRHLQPQVEGTHKSQTGIETTSEVIEVEEKSKTKRSALEVGDKAANVGRSCSDGIGNTSAYVLLKKTAKGTEESSKRTTTVQDQGQVATEELVPKIPPEVSNIGQKEIKDIQIPKKRFMARIQQEQCSQSMQLSAMAPAGNKQPSKPHDEQFAEHSEDVSEETDLATISTKRAPKAFEINLVECTLTVNMPIPFSSGDKKPVVNEEKLGNGINNRNWTKFDRLKEKAKRSEARSRNF